MVSFPKIAAGPKDENTAKAIYYINLKNIYDSLYNKLRGSQAASIIGCLIFYPSLFISTLQVAILDKIKGQHFSIRLILNPSIIALNHMHNHNREIKWIKKIKME